MSEIKRSGGQFSGGRKDSNAFELLKKHAIVPGILPETTKK
jgi:hypothetical protein